VDNEEKEFHLLKNTKAANIKLVNDGLNYENQSPKIFDTCQKIASDED